MSEFIDDIRAVINKHARENNSDTPDFILAKYLERALENFEITLHDRAAWFHDDPKDWSLPTLLD